MGGSPRYLRVRPLGSGAMGEVWLADDTLLGRAVAIKTLRLDSGAAADAERVYRIEREARVAAKVHHANVVGVYDLLVEHGRPQLVMEYVDGHSLAERLNRSGPLAEGEAATLFAQAADGLDAAHRLGVVHRDVKPANILLTPHGQVKVADFGIARSHGDATLTDAGHAIGTIAYMAPEVAGGAAADQASDMWSLGAALYHALEGRPPYGSTADQSMATLVLKLVSEPVPAPLRAGGLRPVLEALLDRDPARRPDARAVARMLASFASGHDATVTRSTLADALVKSAHVGEAPAPVTTRPSQTAPASRPLDPESSRPLKSSTKAVAIWSVAAILVVAIIAAAVSLIVVTGPDGHRRRAAALPSASPVAGRSPAIDTVPQHAATTDASAGGGPVVPDFPSDRAGATDEIGDPDVATESTDAADDEASYVGPYGISVTGPSGWDEDDSANTPSIVDFDEPGSPGRLAGATFRIGVGNEHPADSFEAEAKAAANFLRKQYDATIDDEGQYSTFRGGDSVDIEYHYYNAEYGVDRHAVERLWREDGMTYIVQSGGTAEQWDQTQTVFSELLADVEVG